MIRVTITKELEGFWGAEECLAAGGEAALIELLLEDRPALLDGAAWTIERVAEESDGD